MTRFLPLLLISLTLSACTAAAQQLPSPLPSPAPLTPSDSSSAPTRLTITATVADPADLKVKEGDRIQTGDVIADRAIQRQRLEAQKQQLTITLQRLQTATITPPLPPASVLPIAALPSTSYLEEQAAIERAKVAVDQAERSLTQKQQELEYLGSLPNLDPLVLEHEQAQLAELQQAHTAAVRDYQLAAGRLGKARDDQAYREYQHSLAQTVRVQQANQAALAYQQQWSEYEQRLRDWEFKVAQAQLKLDEVDHALATLSVQRSPYAGRIRRIKWLGQDADGFLSAEITLLVRADPGPGAGLSGEQSRLPRDADGFSNSEFIRD